MSLPKLPKPPRTGNHEFDRWTYFLYEFMGKASTDGLASVNGKITMKASAIPSVPVIAQQLLAIPIGVQFAFNFIDSDTVDGYWIYKSSANSVTSAQRYKFVPQSTSAGVYTFQDNIGSGNTAYYWVTSINAVGESAKVSAGDATSLDPTQTMTVYRPSASAGGGFVPASAAYDNNMNIGASADLEFVHTSVNTTWSGFSAAAGVPTSVKLKISSAIIQASGGNGRLEYSLDGGSTWTTIYSSGVTRTQQTDSVTLLVGQDLTQVQVRATASTSSSSGVVEQDIYEIWIEVVT